MKDQTGDQLEGQCTSHHQMWRTALLQGSEPPSQIIEKTGHRLQNRATISHLQYVDVLVLTDPPGSRAETSESHSISGQMVTPIGGIVRTEGVSLPGGNTAGIVKR